MSIGERIRSLRQERGFSLTQLAAQAGLSKGYLWSLERGGATRPSVVVLEQIARALGVPVGDLLESPPIGDEPRAEDLPAGLREFAEERERDGQPLSAEDLQMLLAIRYRGRRPRTREDFGLLFEIIKRTIR